MTYEVGMQVRVVAIPHGYCSPRIGDVLTVTDVMMGHGVMATTHMDLMNHRALGEGVYHLFFAFDAIEPVVEDEWKTLKELDVKPGDIVKCVGFIDGYNCYWWTIGKTYAVTADGTPADNDGHTYGGCDDPQPAIFFTIVSRAKNTPTSETGPLKKLDVKPGDVVEFISCEYNPFQYYYPEEPKTVTSDNLSSVGVRVYGIFPENDHAIWKVVSRAGETEVQKEEDIIEVFYGFDGIGFFDVEHPYYDERLVLNHTTGTFTLERI